ncbi:unnamed protein product [Orchesella dallaii]|uniref:Reverse transcriptase domain-containing protein n=1 Tax=Orchesella dallaii TaxID=48710 RepID=A0ABP1PJ13_9HEXA
MESASFKTTLLNLFNSFINTGCIPKPLKCARIVPLPKIPKPLHPNDMRPIAIQCAILKLFEKCIISQLNSYLKRMNVLSNSQFGFRERHSTHHALLGITEFIRESYENNEVCIILALDFRKAFDKIDKKVLINKLKWYNIDTTLLESLLEERTQYVMLDDECSDTMTTILGVPQGSSISNLLFSLMINDLPLVFKSVKTIMFADDSTLMIKCNINDVDNMISKLNDDLKALNDWLELNCLELNTDKTEYMICGKPQLVDNLEINISIGNEELRRVKYLKILGLYIDYKLDWDEHYNRTHQKAMYTLSKLFNIRRILSFDQRKYLVISTVLPIINYCSVVWFSGSKSHQLRINKLYKKVARFVLNKSKYDEVSNDMTRILRWLNCKHKYKYECLKLCNSISNNVCPPIFSHVLNRGNFNDITTRNQTYRVPMYFNKTAYGKESFYYQANLLWLNIPDNVKVGTPKMVKQKLQKYCIENQINELPVAQSNICNLSILSCIDHVCGLSNIYI